MAQSLQIAVADDEADMRDFLKKALERLGHTVLGPVENGVKLVELTLSQKPDLVITDVRMPEMTGAEAIQRIHQVYKVPCIVLSAIEKQEAFDGVPHGIPWAFLSKPFRRNDLELAIAQVMRGG